MTMAHYVLLHCHVSILPIHYPYPPSIPPSFPKPPPPSPLFPKALPSLSIPQVRHTESHCVSGLGREHTVRPLTMCCRWTHLRRPTNYCTAFSHTHLASLCPHFLPRSITLLRSPIPPFVPFFLPLALPLPFWKPATINRLHPTAFLTSVYNQTARLKKAIDETLRFQSKRPSRPRGGRGGGGGGRGGGMEGWKQGWMKGRYNLGGHVLLYKIPEVPE